MAQAETGNLAAQANVYGEDEIGTLASNFNRMLTKIRYASEENQNLLSQIKDFNEELSQKVLSATAELAEKNRELRGANQALFETQRSLATSERQALAGQMAASLAHEIGTPLNAISGHVQLIAKTHLQDEKTQRRLKIISSQIEQITATVKDLLVATRQLRMTMRPVEINSLIQETLALTEPVLDARGIIVKPDLTDNLPLVLGDGDRLRQVLLNLINNSIDAMPHGGRLMVHSSLLSIDNGNQQVVIEIRDTGCGIDPEDLDRIFEPMFTTKRIGEGVGLGLAICRETIEEHDGRITVRSETEFGTAFTIELPTYQIDANREKSAVEAVSN
jgi:two-component system, NtrC family, sensor kinase